MDTRIDEISAGIYRVHTPVTGPVGGFSFNQYFVLDDEPLLFHTGPRKLFPLVRAAIERVAPIASLRWIAFSHFEADECGSLDEMLEAAPHAQPMCGKIGAMVSIDDVAARPARALADGETFSIGTRTFRWLDAPHLPHGWDTGYLFETTSRTLFCGDLFTQPGAEHPPIVESDILGPSEAMRRAFDYYAHARDSQALFDKLIATAPTQLACMHGSAWRGDGAKLLGALAESVRG
jgi:flavorubredoxin